MQTLQIGICGCATEFHGRFSRRRLTINNRQFRLVEQIISEDDRQQPPHSPRVHFFLDSHPFTLNSGKENRFTQLQLRGGRNSKSKGWAAPDTPSLKEILKGVRALLERK